MGTGAAPLGALPPVSIAGVSSDAEIAQLAAQKAEATQAPQGSSLAALRAQMLADALSKDTPPADDPPAADS